MDEKIIESIKEIRKALDFDDYLTELWELNSFEYHKNHETGEDFPKCCSDHKAVYEQINEWFNEFPYCCQQHKRLATSSWFDKQRYKDVPIKIIRLIEYTKDWIFRFKDNSDGRTLIIDRIKRGIYSFGIHSIGSEQYLKHILQYLEDINRTRQNDILNQVQTFCEQAISDIMEMHEYEVSPNDIKIKYLLEWFEFFPFELSYFNRFEKAISRKCGNISKNEKKYLYSKFIVDDMLEGHEQNPLRLMENVFLEKLKNLTISIFNNSQEINPYPYDSSEKMKKLLRELVIANDCFERNYKIEQDDFEMYQVHFGVNRGYIATIEDWLKREKTIVLELNQTTDSSKPAMDSKPRDNSMIEIIKHYFEIIDTSKGYKYAFRSEEDYNMYVRLLLNYFEKDEPLTSQEKISLKNGSKVRVQKALNQIYKELSGGKKKAGNTKFFDYVRVLSPFSKLTYDQVASHLSK